MSGASIDVYGRIIEVDTASSEYNHAYQVSMDVEHHKIHDGRHFECYDVDLDVDIAGPKYWFVKSPNNGTRAHVNFIIGASGPGLVQSFVGSTITDNGTELDSFNNDFNSSDVAELLVYKDPTVTVDGDQRYARFMGNVGSAPVGDSGGLVRRESEIIMVPNTNYVLKFSPSNDNTIVSMGLIWYEVLSTS